MTTIAAIQKAPDPIPDLRPPKGEISTDSSESLFFAGALLFSLAVLIIGRIQQLRRPRPVGPAQLPIAIFRRELAQIEPRHDDSLDRSMHAVRRYICDAYEIGSEGLTNEELVTEFAEHPLAAEQSVAALRDYLVGNDFIRFAPLAPASHEAVQRASELVEELEQRRLAAVPPPLPVAS